MHMCNRAKKQINFMHKGVVSIHASITQMKHLPFAHDELLTWTQESWFSHNLMDL